MATKTSIPQDAPDSPESKPSEDTEQAEKTPVKDPLLDMVVGSFRLVRKLGGGGMGTVYLGEHTVIGSKVAVKFLHEHFASNETLVQRFLAEARAVNLIGHENIINIFDMNVLPPRRYYMVMEYLEGSPLSSLTGRPQEPALVVPILTQVCDALQAAHQHGVVHRDLKPENIYLVRHDRIPHFVKVLDFGIAKLFDNAHAGHTSLGTIIGTPDYMAPEQWTGKGVDGRTDLYALAIIAYELLTGRTPFPKGGLGSLLQSHLQETPQPPREVNAAVPEPLSQLIMRTLAKRQEERFQSASELRTALEQTLAPQRAPPQASTPPPRPQLTPARVNSDTLVSHAPTTVQSTRGPATVPPVELNASGVLSPGGAPVRMPCTDVSRGGAFLCTEGALPPLRARLELTLEFQDRRVPCTAEVVRHVPPEQAASWGMRAGFAVQFTGLSPEAREVLSVLSRGQTPLPVSPKATSDDPRAEALLSTMLRRAPSDPYALLSLPLDAPFDDVRQHVRSALAELESIAARPLSSRQAKDLGELRARMEKAAETLSQPRQRIEHDAWRGNYPGVARCISSGLTATEIEALRARYLQAHPGAEARERIHSTTGSAWEAQGNASLALAEFEKALAADPLNLQVQQRYWTLKQRGGRATPAPSLNQDASGPPRRPGRS